MRISKAGHQKTYLLYLLEWKKNRQNVPLLWKQQQQQKCVEERGGELFSNERSEKACAFANSLLLCAVRPVWWGWQCSPGSQSSKSSDPAPAHGARCCCQQTPWQALHEPLGTIWQFHHCRGRRHHYYMAVYRWGNEGSDRSLGWPEATHVEYGACAVKQCKNKPRRTQNVPLFSLLNRLSPAGLKEGKISKLCYLFTKIILNILRNRTGENKVFMKPMMFH